MEKFGRIVTVTIGQPGATGRKLSSVQADGTPGLRISGSVRSTINSSDNTARCTIHGVNDTTLAALQEDGASCVLAAGYQTATVVAAGRIIPGSLTVERKGRVKIPTFEISDGGIDLRAAVVSRAWNQVGSREVLDFLLSESGLVAGSIRPGKTITYARGASVLGTVESNLRTWARDTESLYAVTGGVVDVWPKGGTRETMRVVMSPSSGLVAVEPAEAGQWVATTLMEPAMRGGDSFRVSSSTYRGVLKSTEVVHDFDSGWSQEFYTTVTGVPA